MHEKCEDPLTSHTNTSSPAQVTAGTTTSEMASIFRSLRCFGSLQARPTASTSSTSSTFSSRLTNSIAQSSFSTTITQSTWGGGKLKTHQGTKKRFKPVSKKRNRPASSLVSQMFPQLKGQAKKEANILFAKHNIGDGLRQQPQNVGARPGPLFKRGQAGKRHLNLNVSGSKLNSMGGTKVVGQGRLGWHLRKLMPYA
ncbi:unnamed protein product [Sympodiomycopsis kandeliae]